MNPAHVSLFGLAESKLSWIERRQTLLAQNIANAATPGWKSRDLKPFSAALEEVSVQPARTDPAHLAGGPSQRTDGRAILSATAPDGNGVAVDEELKKIADTDASHDLVSQIYKKYLGFFRMALGK